MNINHFIYPTALLNTLMIMHIVGMEYELVNPLMQLKNKLNSLTNQLTIQVPVKDQPQEEKIDFLTMLYQSYNGIPLYIYQEEIHDSGGDLKSLFEKYEIVILGKSWTDEKWKKLYKKFMKRANKENVHSFPTPKLLPELLIHAKSILKAFLLTDDSELPSIKEKFIEKFSSLGRLFTYAKIQQVIHEEKISHVRLPRKVLILREKETGNYVSSKETPKIIDDALKISTSPLDKGDINIKFISDKYELVIFAHKEVNHKVNLKVETHEDLNKICQKAPFDVGFDNIFRDLNGDAVIIDTENKGEPTENCLEKINRYFSK